MHNLSLIHELITKAMYENDKEFQYVQSDVYLRGRVQLLDP